MKSENNAWTRLGTETPPTKPFPEKIVFGTKEDQWSAFKYSSENSDLQFQAKRPMGTTVFYDGRGVTPWHGVRCIDPKTGEVMKTSKADSERVQLVFYSRTRVDRLAADTDPHGHVAHVRQFHKDSRRSL